jgi:dienelactone hydrolase
MMFEPVLRNVKSVTETTAVHVCTLIVACLVLAAEIGSAAGPPTDPSGSQYRHADLPPLLQFFDGTPVRTKADLARRTEEIRRLFCETFIGSFPTDVPAVIRAEILDEQNHDDGSKRRRIKLTFDTTNKASFEMWVWLPSGRGPFPLLLTQPRFYQIYWAEDALQRGYITCLYPGLDVHHKEPDYPGYENVWRTFQAEYPAATWASSLAIQGWLASRALDYLLDPKYAYDVARDQVGIIGFSRYGKQSLYAASFDERFTSVVARSSGSPTAAPYRFAGRQTFMESIEDFPSPWARASLRAFHGREHQLPIEGHGLLALIAPRRCMLHTAHNDGADPTFGVERAYLQGREVYRFLGKPENLRNMYRTGNHASGPPPDLVTAEHRRQNLDWFDLSFGRGTAKQSDFPEVLLHDFDWDAWKATQTDGELDNPFRGTPRGRDAADQRTRIRWVLGEIPPNIDGEGQYHIRSADELGVPDSSRDRWACADTARMPVSFGGRIHGNVYYNPKIEQPVPAIIWLHPLNYSHGSNEGYGVQGTTVYHRLAQKGFVVLAYDQCGFGDRLLEGPDFYEKYPKWSRLGRMVYDVHAAVDFLVEGKGIAAGELPKIDRDDVRVLGYSLGGMVGLYAAALDERIHGVASFCGFTPLRTDTDAKPTGGIRRWWQWHALQPRLGLFHGREGEIPYDFDDVLALIAPRPCLIYAPRRDRDADPRDIDLCINRARQAWRHHDAAAALSYESPDDINRFQMDQHDVFLEWDRESGSGPSW